MTPERPNPGDPPAEPGEAVDEQAKADEEAYSEDEEAAVAARLEDLGYI